MQTQSLLRGTGPWRGRRLLGRGCPEGLELSLSTGRGREGRGGKGRAGQGRLGLLRCGLLGFEEVAGCKASIRALPFLTLPYPTFHTLLFARRLIRGGDLAGLHRGHSFGRTHLRNLLCERHTHRFTVYISYLQGPVLACDPSPWAAQPRNPLRQLGSVGQLPQLPLEPSTTSI